MPYLTQTEAADHLGITRNTISRDWRAGKIVAAGTVKVKQKADPVPVFSIAEVDRYGGREKGKPGRPRKNTLQC